MMRTRPGQRSQPSDREQLKPGGKKRECLQMVGLN